MRTTSLAGALLLCLCLGWAQAEGATLTITTNGTNTGAVAVMPVGQSCNPPFGGGTCTLTIPDGTAIRVAASSPLTPGVFSGGTGDAAACGPWSTCSFTITQNSSIVVSFNSGSYPSVTIVPGGDGATDVGADNNRCQSFEVGASSCTVYYAAGSVVRLEGRNAPLGLFAGFSGGTGEAAACSSTPCEFTMTANATVTATAAALASFSVAPPSVTLAIGQAQPYTAVASFTNGGSRSLLSGPGLWQSKRLLPSARFSLATVTVGPSVFAIGGVIAGAPSGRVDRYWAGNPPFGFDSWTQMASMLTPREGLAAAAVGDRIYAFGGHTTGGGLTAAVEAYDVTTDTWSARGPMPNPRTGGAAVAGDGVIYVIGGGDQSAPLDLLEMYDPQTDFWTTLAPMPTPRTGLAAVAVEGIIYAIGGFGADGNLATVEAYDPAAGTWSTKTSMPTARTVLEAGIVNGVVYAIGGYDNGAVAAVEAYYPFVDDWTALGPLPQPRSQFGLAALDSRLFVFGGITGSDPSTSVTTHHSFRPPEATWFSADAGVATLAQGQAGAVGTAVGYGSTLVGPAVGGKDCGDVGNSCGEVNVPAPPPPPPPDPIYLGNGQRAGVNVFLAYRGVVKRRTVFADDTVLQLTIEYGPTIIGSTFTATFDGASVAGYLHPVAGTSETVDIPLDAGRHVLDLRVEGVAPNGKRRTDKDRLAFVVK